MLVGCGYRTGARSPLVLVQIQDVTKHFPIYRGISQRTVGSVKAVDGVSFEIASGTTLGLVGESGCGKSTLARTVVRLVEATSGKVLFDGIDLLSLRPQELRAFRPKVQMIFQDPYSSLNPRMRVGKSVAEPLLEHRRELSRSERGERVDELLSLVGLDPALGQRYPHEFSGGQRQRIGIARALALSPQLVVCDEPISALDVSIQAQIVNLLNEVQVHYGLSYLFISHDLGMVRRLSDRVAVMYLGKIAELAPAEALFERAQHPYTRALLSAVPQLSATGERRQRTVLSGEVPSPIEPPDGCRFATRCPLVEERCRREEPPLRALEGDHRVACHLA